MTNGTDLAHVPGSDRFLYRTVSRRLRELIKGGEYVPGQQLPSAGDLSEQFGVSIITIRRAIRDLSLEGQLVGRQGLGVFVANQRRIVRVMRPNGAASMEDDILAAGLVPGIREMHMSMAISGTDAELGGRDLGIGYRLERIILADEEPVALDLNWVSQDLGDISRIRGHFVLAAALERPAFDHVDYQIEGATATVEQADLLGVTAGVPVLITRYSAFGSDLKPLVVGRTVARADRFVYDFRMRSSGASESPQ